MERRSFVLGFGAVSVLGLYPRDARAWIFLLGRIAAGFAGRTIAGTAARRVLVSTTTRVASRTVQQRTNQHIVQMSRNTYPRNEMGLSAKFAAYTAEEVGDYAGKSAFDHAFRLNETLEGGQEIAGSGDVNDLDVVHFTTGNAAREVPGLQANYLLCLARLSSILSAQGKNGPAQTGLIYPVAIIDNNMIAGSWNSHRPTVFSSAFGFVQMRPYIGNNGFYMCDFAIHDILSRRDFVFDGVPAERYY